MLAVLVAATVTSGVGNQVGAAGRPPTTVSLYGDSIFQQASPYLTTDFNTNKTKVAVSAFGGLPLCYWLPDIARLTESTAPYVAVIESAGDIWSTCMNGYSEPDSVFLAKYRADFTTAINDFLRIGTKYVIVAPAPPLRKATARRIAFDSMVRDVVARFNNPNVIFGLSIARSVETPLGAYAQYLPCLRVERLAGNCPDPTSGNEVRSPDGSHFCPVNSGTSNGQVELCPQYTSGAYRYALALGEEIWDVAPRSAPKVLPMVASITPQVGSVLGNNTVDLVGTNLASVRSVAFKAIGTGIFGWTQLTTTSKVTVISDKRLRIVVPSLYASPPPGVTVYVSVRTSDAASFWDAITALSYREQ